MLVDTAPILMKRPRYDPQFNFTSIKFICRYCFIEKAKIDET